MWNGRGTCDSGKFVALFGLAILMSSFQLYSLTPACMHACESQHPSIHQSRENLNKQGHGPSIRSVYQRARIADAGEEATAVVNEVSVARAPCRTGTSLTPAKVASIRTPDSRKRRAESFHDSLVAIHLQHGL